MAKWVIRTAGDYRQFRQDLQWRFKELATAMVEASALEIQDMLADVLEKAVPRAPIDEGSLRESGHCRMDGVVFARGSLSGSITRRRAYPSAEAKQFTFEIGFWVPDGGTGREGDVNTYAWVQHEHTEFNHPKGGQAKFLETALIEERMKWRKRLAEALSKEVREVMD